MCFHQGLKISVPGPHRSHKGVFSALHWAQAGLCKKTTMHNRALPASPSIRVMSPRKPLIIGTHTLFAAPNTLFGIWGHISKDDDTRKVVTAYWNFLILRFLRGRRARGSPHLWGSGPIDHGTIVTTLPSLDPPCPKQSTSTSTSKLDSTTTPVIHGINVKARKRQHHHRKSRNISSSAPSQTPSFKLKSINIEMIRSKRSRNYNSAPGDHHFPSYHHFCHSDLAGQTEPASPTTSHWW